MFSQLQCGVDDCWAKRSSFCSETVEKIIKEHEAAAKTRAEAEYVNSCLPRNDVVIAGLHVTSRSQGGSQEQK